MHAFHVNDYPADPPQEEINDSHRVYPGDGVCPLKSILKTLHVTGFRGMLSLELFNRDYWQQPALTVAKTGLEKTRAAVQKALGHRGLPIKMLGNLQLGRRVAQSRDDQHQRHRRPRDLFLTLGNRGVQKILQPELPDHFQGQPGTAEVTAVLHPNVCRVHFHPLRLDFLKQFLLSMGRSSLCRLLDAQSPFFIELPQIGHHPLPRAALGSVGLHQRPVGVPFAVLLTVARANEHA